MTSQSKIIFVGNARSYHTLDLCRSLHKHLPKKSWVFFTDCIESEGHIRIIDDQDAVQKLLLIDPLLFRDQSTKANLWRNLLKLLLAPLQAVLLKIRVGNPKEKVIHAHTFYYGMLCRMAKLPFFFTPQGGELTERPKESDFYRFLMQWTLSGAKYTFVDSRRMLNMAQELGCKNVSIHQYGIDTASCLAADIGLKRWRVISNRGIEKNYQIDLIQTARDRECDDVSLTFFYPLWDSLYRSAFQEKLRPNDQDLGRIEKIKCYQLYAESILVISIPRSDSSPRSVYEAIFCGVPVATVSSPWVDDLPFSMRKRVLLVDPQSPGWFRQAYIWAQQCVNDPFVPCSTAISKFDQFAVAYDIVHGFYFSDK
ncbi:glycosyltransferase [Spirulina sp. CCNP1310]|uniref:glycosyltransferase n=1 Tax=Spirulina sp. CCNP1310 TaxID=3110249 RepID=UPI002B206C1E|nr:glycosyltransferase [Spirulina sp. CCNP1310]MEA5421449.1 glycosyltransferase [Spirulina sp. CCNP1310]